MTKIQADEWHFLEVKTAISCLFIWPQLDRAFLNKHWKKMATMLQITFWNAFSWKKMFGGVTIWRKILVKFVPRGPIDNKSALVHLMLYRRKAFTRTNVDTDLLSHKISLGYNELKEYTINRVSSFLGNFKRSLSPGIWHLLNQLNDTYRTAMYQLEIFLPITVIKLFYNNFLKGR